MRKHNRYKKARPFGHLRTPFDPLTGQHFGLVPKETGASSASAVIQVKEFSVSQEFSNFLMCHSEVDGEEAVIAKPYILRRDAYDGKTINDIAYSTMDPDGQCRKAEGPAYNQFAFSELQYITPSYFVGEKILAAPAEIVVSDGACSWVDINSAGRCWASYA